MSNAERQAAFRQRRAEEGRAEVRGIFLPTRLHAAVREFAAQLVTRNDTAAHAEPTAKPEAAPKAAAAAAPKAAAPKAAATPKAAPAPTAAPKLSPQEQARHDQERTHYAQTFDVDLDAIDADLLAALEGRPPAKGRIDQTLLPLKWQTHDYLRRGYGGGAWAEAARIKADYEQAWDASKGYTLDRARLSEAEHRIIRGCLHSDFQQDRQKEFDAAFQAYTPFADRFGSFNFERKKRKKV